MRLLLVSFLSALGCVYKQISNSESWIYDGNVNKTVNGHSCDTWTFTNDEALVNETHNFCRNPDMDASEMWCIVNGGKEYCDVGVPSKPLCSNPAPIRPTVQCNPVTNRTLETRIVGGVPATPHEFPFFALLYRNGAPQCGGSLVAPGWVLTAAHCHCVDGTPASSLRVKINPYDTNNPDHCEESRGVLSIHPHPDFDQISANDFCLLQLDEPSSYTPIQLRSPAVAAKDGLEQLQKMLTVIGFGDTQSADGSPMSPILRKTQVPVVPTNSCLATYGLDIGNDRMCAGYYGGRIDSCQGDSGGPLFSISPTGAFWLVGTSIGGGSPCALIGLYGVYGRVVTAYNWIRTTINSAGSLRCYDCLSRGFVWVQSRDLGQMGCTDSCDDYPAANFTCTKVKNQCPEVAGLGSGTCWRRCKSGQKGIYTGPISRPSCQCDAGCVQKKNCCADRAYYCWPY